MYYRFNTKKALVNQRQQILLVETKWPWDLKATRISIETNDSMLTLSKATTARSLFLSAAKAKGA